MAAVPNQGNGVAVECMNLKGGRTAMAAFPDQVGDWQGGECGMEPTGEELKRGRTAMAAFPDEVRYRAG